MNTGERNARSDGPRWRHRGGGRISHDEVGAPGDESDALDDQRAAVRSREWRETGENNFAGEVLLWNNPVDRVVLQRAGVLHELPECRKKTVAIHLRCSWDRRGKMLGAKRTIVRSRRGRGNLCKLLFVGIAAYTVITLVSMTRRSARNEDERAFVTTCDNDGYAEGAIALAKSLHHVGSRYPLIVLVHSLSVETRSKLKKVPGVQLVDVDPVELPKTVRPKVSRWVKAFTKFRAWDLPLKRAFFIDSDAVLLVSVDDLLEPKMRGGGTNDLWAAIEPRLDVCDQMSPELDLALNSGLLIITPSRATSERLLMAVRSMADEGRVEFNDQDVLMRVFPNWRALPYPEYGGHVVQCECKGFLERIRVLHFTAGLGKLPKPWTLPNPKEDLFPFNSTCVRSLFSTWRHIRALEN